MEDSSFVPNANEISTFAPESYGFMQQEENLLTTRLERTMKVAQPIVYEFTKDKGYLHQYYLLREQVYTQVWDLKGFVAQEDEFDKRGMIVIARKGNQVVGGARLNFRDPRNNMLLPGESNDFEFYKALPEMRLENKKLAECTRLAALPEARKERVAEKLIDQCIRKSMAMNADYGLFISPELQAKVHGRSLRSIGIDYRIMDQVQIPLKEEYEGISMKLACIDFKLCSPKVNISEDTKELA